MISDAVEAAKQGLVRATIDSRWPVKHEKDERPSCRVRLSPETWEALTEMVETMKTQAGEPHYNSRSDLVADLIKGAWRDMKRIKP